MHAQGSDENNYYRRKCIICYFLFGTWIKFIILRVLHAFPVHVSYSIVFCVISGGNTPLALLRELLVNWSKFT